MKLSSNLDHLALNLSSRIYIPMKFLGSICGVEGAFSGCTTNRVLYNQFKIANERLDFSWIRRFLDGL